VTNEVIGSVPALPSETATPEAAQPNAATTQAQTDGAEGGETSPVAEKTFTQKELDDIIKREKARTEAKTERRVLRTVERLTSQNQAQPSAQSQPAGDGRPLRSQFDNEDAWLDARDAWRDQQRVNQANNSKTDKLYAEAKKVPGFDQEAFDDLPLTPAIVHALADSDVAPRLMHYMASNPEEVQRISQLPPARQAAAIGKLEAKLEAEPAKLPRTSKTPDPIGDPTAKANTTTTPSDPNRMNPEQYREFRKKQGARWAQ
jgi:hypothetical protein